MEGLIAWTVAGTECGHLRAPARSHQQEDNQSDDRDAAQTHEASNPWMNDIHRRSVRPLINHGGLP